jgi:hypothetical protein
MPYLGPYYMLGLDCMWVHCIILRKNGYKKGKTVMYLQGINLEPKKIEK